MIEKVIIGEKENNGETNPRVITFILKSGNEIKCKDDEKQQENQQSSYEVSQNYLQPMCEPLRSGLSFAVEITFRNVDIPAKNQVNQF